MSKKRPVIERKSTAIEIYNQIYGTEFTQKDYLKPHLRLNGFGDGFVGRPRDNKQSPKGEYGMGYNKGLKLRHQDSEN